MGGFIKVHKTSLSAFSERLVLVINMDADFSHLFESKLQQDSRTAKFELQAKFGTAVESCSKISATSTFSYIFLIRAISFCIFLVMYAHSNCTLSFFV